jgi:parallel beta-helix repeat protein
MSGDYSRFSFKAKNRFSSLRQQQGRVHLDSEFNEAFDIVRHRERVQSLDTFGPFGVPQLTTPDAFKVGIIGGPPADLSLQPGRIYVEGWLVELFDTETASYLKQPFLPDPPPLPAGDAVVYLDVWQREVTYVEDAALLDVALLGVDTTTRMQTVWQLRVDAHPGAECGLPVGAPASAGRLSTEAIAPPAPDDPCILPPVAGYRGLENRLYRIEIHTGGPLGTARFKWSRDNGSIVSPVTGIAIAGGQTTLSVQRIGRDQFLRFAVDNWVSVTDDVRELMGEPGEMARVVSIDEANNKIVLDRALPLMIARPFGATAADIAARHTRVQRWDQTAAANTVDANGLIATAAGPIDIEDGIRIRFDVDPVGGSFRDADYWVFWARTATASIEILDHAPPRGIIHHYVQLAAATGLGGGAPDVTDCRPKPPPVVPGGDEACCCTIVVSPGEDIQKAIDSLPDAGGCVCLKTGIHNARDTIVIARSNVKLVGESPGTIVRAPNTVLLIGGRSAIHGVEVQTIDFQTLRGAGDLPGVVTASNAERSSIVDCSMIARSPQRICGVALIDTKEFRVAQCWAASVAVGVLVSGRSTGEVTVEENLFDLADENGEPLGLVGVVVQKVFNPCRIERNTIRGGLSGIIVNDTLTGVPESYAGQTMVCGNRIACLPIPEGSDGVLCGIDVAAGASLVQGNIVGMMAIGDQAPIGIRVTGADTQCTGNEIGIVAKTDSIKAVGIAVGYFDGKTATATRAVIVADNRVDGPPFGIAVTDAISVSINQNVINGGEQFTGAVDRGTGIGLTRVIGSQINDNIIENMSTGIQVESGSANRVVGNTLTNGARGVSLFKDNGPFVAQNRITNMLVMGMALLSGSGRFDVIGNRVASCGYKADIGIGIIAGSIAGDVHLDGNEVRDTGLSPDLSVKAPVAIGIGVTAVLEARVEGNFVTYSDPTSRPTTNEDRALVMMGLYENPRGEMFGSILPGYPVQILGNKFVGFGQSALVQLRENKSDTSYTRFERVLFDNNYCMHLTPPKIISKTVATVVLVGRAASVMGNQIKAMTRQYPSIDFTDMPGPCIGNVLYGPIIRHGTAPAVDGNFNMTI